MKGWWLPIGMMLGLIAAAMSVWSLVGWPAMERSPATAPSHRATLATAAQTASGAASQPRAVVPAVSNLDALFAALAVHRPPQPVEAPDFTLPDVEGRPVRLRELRGKLVFLNFWATWCPPCRLEMPSLERLYQTFKQTAFALLAVSIDRQGVEAVQPFMAELQLTFPALLDQASEVARRYGLRGLPTTYLIDPEGWIIGAAVGGRDWDRPEAKALIAGLLRQASTAANATAPGPAAAGR